MPTLEKTAYVAEIVWLGQVPAGGGLVAQPVERLEAGFDGLVSNRHSGALRPACSRVSNLHPEGTPIRNTRQLTVLAQEDLDAIAAQLDLPALDPALLGASVVLRGIPDFTRVPPSSRLQAGDGLTLVVDMENRPCVYPAREIESRTPGHGKGFLAAARGRRGVTAWVERPGTLRLGDRLSLFIPDQRPWQP